MSKKIRADDIIMGQLHEAIARELLAKVNSGQATAQELNAAIKFLDNNNIQGEINNPEQMKTALKQFLPSFEDDSE